MRKFIILSFKTHENWKLDKHFSCTWTDKWTSGNMNVNEFIFEKFERERERVHILRDELERELERQKNANV